ncbi:MAG TPA: tetraacyldisaccharide 4'-kinase, partial [Polyangiales bacterium]|nr:tetraacyldisaccharide 4'-kinase [Polyangiales bacterium]
VGNLTLGGTGKTPMVEWIARHLRRRNLRVALVSRGYGASEETRNDEALELEQRLPDVPHVQNADRVAASRMAIEEFESQVIVLDDGYQHRRLARDLDLVLIDAAEPFGYGRVFPRGMLREPLAGLKRADAVILTRADMVDEARRAEIRHAVERHVSDAIWAEVRHAPRQLMASDGKAIALEQLHGARVAAFCGIGNPAGFRHTLEACGCQIVAMREFADHHAYTRDDVVSLARWAAEPNVSMVVCTHKDLVKIGLDALGGVPLWALAIGVDFISGRDALEAAIDAISPRESPGIHDASTLT